MGSIRNIHHIVLRTRYNRDAIPEETKRTMFKRIFSFCLLRDCRLLRLNGVSNHIHLLVELPARLSLESFIRALQRDGLLISDNMLFADFPGWSDRVFSVTVSPENAERVRQHIINQERYHAETTFSEEMSQLFFDAGMHGWETFFDDGIEEESPYVSD